MNQVHQAYYTWLQLDQDWHTELLKVYTSQAGNARYDERGSSTPTLKSLKDAWQAGRLAWVKALESK